MMVAGCKFWDAYYERPCGCNAPFNGYCGPHRRMIERDKIRAQNPSLSHWEAERLTPRFNIHAERSDITEEVKALRYVLPHLKYREAREKVLASRA